MKNRKTILVTAVMLAVSAGAGAVTVGDAVRIDGVSHAWHPVLSPTGDKLLFSSEDHTGLNCLDLTDNSVTEIDNAAAAGFDPVFSHDGQTVIYTTAKLVDGLTNRDIRAYNLRRGDAPRVVSPMSRRETKLRPLTQSTDFAMADYSDIKVTVNGQTKAVNPVADAHSYLWASLSPDGSRLLFCEPFQGVFVSNTDGTDARRIAAKGDFPTWAGNNVVVYVHSTDDGYLTLTSQLKAVDLTTGQTTDITDNDTLVGEVTAAPTGRVVYSTLSGELYMLTVK